MFRFLAKSAIASFLWAKYRKIAISTAGLFAVYFMVSFLHDDYLKFATQSGDNSNIGLSFIIKWAALLLATAVYYYFNLHRKRTSKTATEPGQPTTSKRPLAEAVHQNGKDPFNNIRNKPKLNSKIDKLLKD